MSNGEYRCKPCASIANKKWWAENPEKVKEYVRNRPKGEPKRKGSPVLTTPPLCACGMPKVRVGKKPKWRCRPCDRAATLAQRNKRLAENPEATRAGEALKVKTRRAADRVAARAYDRHWRKANPEKYKIIERRSKAKNVLNVRARQSKQRARTANALGSHTGREWAAILKRYKYKCAHCGSDKDITKDHIVPIARGGSDYALNLQPLCRPCNSSKSDAIQADIQFSLFDRI